LQPPFYSKNTREAYGDILTTPLSFSNKPHISLDARSILTGVSVFIITASLHPRLITNDCLFDGVLVLVVIEIEERSLKAIRLE
jgi:hypothetical protein